MDEFCRRLTEAMKNAGLNQTELAEKSGIRVSSINGYVNGQYRPKFDRVLKLAAALGVAPSYLLGGSAPTPEAVMARYAPPAGAAGYAQPPAKKIPTRVPSAILKIPVLGRVAAGLPFLAESEIIDWEEVSIHLATHGDHFGLRIRGDSMAPRILDGDVVIVRQQEDADSGDVVVVLINGEDATCKRLKKTSAGIVLSSINPNYPPLFYTPEEVRELPVQIIGKVIELRGKF